MENETQNTPSGATSEPEIVSGPSANQDIEDNKVIAAIGYLFILCLVPLLLRKDSKFAQFHGKQGLVLVVAWFIVWIIGWVPFIGWLIGFFGSIALLVIALLGIYKALQGEFWEIPYLGKYTEKITL